MYIKKIINFFIFSFIYVNPSFPLENFISEFDVDGTWASKEVCVYFINKKDFSSLKKNKFGEKNFTDDGLIIRLSTGKSEFGIIGISNPWKINKLDKQGKTITLLCNRIFYDYENSNFIELFSDDSEIITIKIVDNCEIIFENFSYPKGTHFYRISGPAKIPIKNAVLNDTNVRLRIKPNLNCDTWVNLNKGTKVKIKDKSSEKYEINGEKWYWYYVDIENYPDGWVYGKYLDIEK